MTQSSFEADAPPPRRAARTWMALAPLVVLVALVFGRTLGFRFTSWDDDVNVTANPRLAGTPASAAGFWAAPYSGLYIPLTYTVFVAETALSSAPGDAASPRFDPRVFHAGSLVLHAAAACLVYVLLVSLVRRPWPAFAGAALWAVHPLQVESVAWISETKGLLSAVFMLLALHAYLRSRDDAAPRRGAPYAIATVAFGLALLAKPVAMTLPLLAWLLDVARPGRAARAAWRPLVPWLLLATGFALFTKRLQPDAVVLDVTPWFARPVIALDALGFYLGRIVWPFHLAIDYGRSPSSVLARAAWGGLWLLPLGVAALGALRSLRRTVGFALAWIVAATAPVLGLVPFGYQYTSTVADRYLYVALFGPALAVAWTLSRRGRVGAIAVATLLAALAVLAARQAGTWRDNATLYAHALAVNPGSVHANNNLGLLELAAGHARSALARFDRALATRSDYVPALVNRAKALRLGGDPVGSLAAAGQALRIAPAFAPAHVEAALALQDLDRPDEAAPHLEAALAADPADPDVNLSLGRYALAHGNPVEAEALLRRAVAADPGFVDARLELAGCLWRRGDEDGATAQYEAALRANPDSFEAHRDLGKLRMNRGDPQGAAAQWRRAAALRPDDAEVRGYLDRLGG